MSWTRTLELFIEAAFVGWLIDLFRRPVPERYRRSAAVHDAAPTLHLNRSTLVGENGRLHSEPPVGNVNE